MTRVAAKYAVLDHVLGAIDTVVDARAAADIVRRDAARVASGERRVLRRIGQYSSGAVAIGRYGSLSRRISP